MNEVLKIDVGRNDLFTWVKNLRQILEVECVMIHNVQNV